MNQRSEFFPDAFHFNKLFGKRNMVQCMSRGNKVTVAIGGRTVCDWAYIDGSELDLLIQTLSELKTQCHDLFENDQPLDLSMK
jgi:hypothetical protein